MPYRQPAEIEADNMSDNPMSEQAFNLKIFHGILWGAIVVLFGTIGSCTYSSVHSDNAKVEAARIEHETAKANADKAMFESLKK